jgi:hypothetical protein
LHSDKESRVPRFFFHLREDEFSPDPDGIEFPDAAAAKAAAVDGARGMICDQVKKGRLCLGYALEVEDEAGTPLFTLRFDEAVEIEP